MIVARDIVDRVNFELDNLPERPSQSDPEVIFEILSWIVTDTVQERSWTWNRKWLEPMIRTSTGVRDYALPDDFPENFVYGGGLDRYDRHVCMLDNASSDSPLEFMPTEQFFSVSRTGASNSTPGRYTIITLDGGKQIHLDPPPDANGSTGYYEVNGLYAPTKWRLEQEDDRLPASAPVEFFVLAVLARLLRPVDPNLYSQYRQLAEQKKSEMRHRDRSGRAVRMIPRLSDLSTGNRFKSMRMR